jgi:hypothetical protein
LSGVLPAKQICRTIYPWEDAGKKEVSNMKKNSWKRTLLLILLASLLILVLSIVNALQGNPISKALVRQRTLAYYEETYRESFTVYAGYYNFKIPAYVFEMGPDRDREIRFSTALYTMGISDEYGGILGGALLAEDIQVIFGRHFPDQVFQIEAKEDPLTGYAKEEPDYFQTDPALRVRLNHYIVKVMWTAQTDEPENFQVIFDDMVVKIYEELPYTTPNLIMLAEVQSPAGSVIWQGQTGTIFPLF